MHLLLVEDNPTDRMVIRARLRRAFPGAQIMAADDPNGLVGSSRVDLQACKLEYSIVSPK